MKLSKDELQILNWAAPAGMCAIVWPIGADDSLYLAGCNLERLGFLRNIQHSPEIWKITNAGRESLARSAGPVGDGSK